MQQFSNLAQTTLGANYTAGSSTLTLASGAGALFPTTGLFTIGIGDPPSFYLVCTGRSGDVLTVNTSGAEGTTAVNAGIGTIVAQVLSAGVLNTLRSGVPTYVGSSLVAGTILGQTFSCVPSSAGGYTSITNLLGSYIVGPANTGGPVWGNPPYMPISTNYFQVQLSAVFTVPIGYGGTWTFWTSSDDGSQLSINGSVVVANNFGGTQSQVEVSGTVVLTPGVTYYALWQWGNSTGGWGFNAHWQQPVSGTKAYLSDASGALSSPFTIGGVVVSGVRFGDQVFLKKASDNTTIVSATCPDFSTTSVALPICLNYTLFPISAYIVLEDAYGNIIGQSATQTFYGNELFRVT
jgi:hypothetical protein